MISQFRPSSSSKILFNLHFVIFLLRDIQFVICAIASQGSNMQEMPIIMAIIILSVDLEDENVALKDRPSLHRLLVRVKNWLIFNNFLRQWHRPCL